MTGGRGWVAHFAVLLGLIAALSGSAAAVAATPQEILLARPLAPTDRDLFSTAVYPDASPMAPAPGGEPSQQQVSTMLNTYLQQELSGNPAAQNAAKAIYNSSAAKSKIASPSLRAALVGLKGTFAEPAISFILNAQTSSGNPKVTTVKFVPPNQTPVSAYAGVYGAGTADPQQIEIRFNNRYQAENPFLLTSTMAHEALHQDLSVANVEEAVISSLDNLIEVHQLAHHPGLARLGTELSRRINTRTLERLNTGTGADLGLYATNANRMVFPGSSTALERSWWEYADTGDRTTTPGNPFLRQYLAKSHTGSGQSCSGAIFSRALLDCIDAEGNGGLSSAELLAAARAMKLDTNVERSRTLSIAYKRGAFRGKLSSPARPCAAGKQVSVYKQRPGPDAKLGTDRTSSTGVYSLEQRHPKGSYYAAVKRSTLAGTGVCLAAASKKVNR